MTDSKKATFYLQLEPRWSGYKDYLTGKRALDSVVATRVTQKKPERALAGSITVKLSINIPKSVFEPFEPDVEITIPENNVHELIEVNVEPRPELELIEERGTDE